MRASRHTTGPWRSAYPIVYAASGAELLHIDERDCATVFDCHLIAAATELLEALQEIDQRLRTCMEAPGMSMISVADAYDSFYQDIVAQALAKAAAKQPDPTR